MKFFEGCTALITGASSGLGAEFARQLAPYAEALVLVARRNDRLESLRAELTSLRPDLSVFVYVADVAEQDQLTTLVRWLREQGISVDFLINNAGLGDHGLFENSDWGRVQAMLDVNIAALTRLTHLLIPELRASGRGAILNVSSVAAFVPIPQSAVYAATKAYVSSLTEALRIELKGKGVRVTALCPGPVETEFFEVATREANVGYNARSEAGKLLVVSVRKAVSDGLEAVAANRARKIPGLILALAMAVTAVVPMMILRKILERRVDRYE